MTTSLPSERRYKFLKGCIVRSLAIGRASPLQERKYSLQLKQNMKVGVPVTLLLLLMTGESSVVENVGSRLPDSIPRCSRSDPDLNLCLHAAIEKAIQELKNGNPDLQMPPLDPLVVTNISIQDGAGRPVKITLDLHDVKIHGLSNGHLKTVRADLENGYLEFQANVPLTTVEADYVMEGKFLVLPIKGNGKCNMNLTDYDVTVRIRSDPLSRAEDVYWDVKEFDMHVVNLKLFQVNFENLFNGEKELGDNTNKVLNVNWKDFFEELRPTLHDTFGYAFLNVANTLFHKVPEKEIFLD